MQISPSKLEDTANLHAAASKLRIIGNAIHEETAKAGLTHITAMLIDTIGKIPQSPDSRDYDDFLSELQAITGIVVLIAGNTSNPSPLWQNFQKIAIDLLDALTKFKKRHADAVNQKKSPAH